VSRSHWRELGHDAYHVAIGAVLIAPFPFLPFWMACGIAGFFLGVNKEVAQQVQQQNDRGLPFDFHDFITSTNRWRDVAGYTLGALVAGWGLQLWLVGG
jgi:hypothetical protein